MRRMLVAALAAVLVGLTGCFGVPDSGPVMEGRVDTDQEAAERVFLPQEPTPGATQEEIVLGFLQAAISSDENYAIAREYLTGAAAEEWDPSDRVIVRTGAQPDVTLTGDDVATAAVTGLSGLGAGGELQPGAGDQLLEFRLEQVEGEWRIVGAPDGIVLSGYYFDQLFEPHTLHWLTQDGERSVPEVRWFERTASRLAARIVDAHLAGPSTWLSPAVSTFGAVEAKRVGEPVLEGRVLTVLLDAVQVQQLGTGSLRPLAQQLALSMEGLEVDDVRIRVDGLDAVSASSADGAQLDTGQVDQRPLVLEESTLRSIGGGAQAFDEYGTTLAAIGARSFTVGAEGGVAHTGSTAAWIERDADPVIISAESTPVPTVDDSGWVLVQERSAEQRLLAWRDGERAELILPGGIGAIAAMELSRDGSRLAVVSAQGTPNVRILAVVRDASGRPVALGEPYPLPAIDGVGSDITWVSATQVAVLATVEDQAAIAILTVGGVVEQLPVPSTAVQAIVGGSEGVGTLRALDSEGALLSLRGRVWSPAPGIAPIRLIATQQ